MNRTPEQWARIMPFLVSHAAAAHILDEAQQDIAELVAETAGLPSEISKLRAKVERLQAMTAITAGVGDGDGNLFVHGNYGSIKRVQAMVFDGEALRSRLLKYEDAEGNPQPLMTVAQHQEITDRLRGDYWGR